MKSSTRKFLRTFIPVFFTILGAAGGWTYYYFIGCASGTCPIVSSPILMPIYGAGIGLMTGIIFQPGEKKKGSEPEA